MGFSDFFLRKQLTIEDLSYLSKLLDTGMSLNDSLNLLKNRRNEKVFKAIREKLDQGTLIEKLMPDYLPKEIKPFISSLAGNLSFAETLSLSLYFYKENKDGQNGFFSSIAYPCILLFATLTALYLFDLYGMDAIFSLIRSFDADLSLYQDLRMLFRIMINIFYYLLLIGTLVLVFYMQPKRIVLLYAFLSEHFPDSLINVYYSEEFMSLLLICLNKGFKTRQALELLKKMKSKPVISFLAFHLDESLMEGEMLKEATKKKYYDSSLSRFIKIANYTNEFNEVVSSYTRMAKEKITRRLKRYTLTIQLATYFFIGAVIVFIYQILFMPMQAISAY